MSEIKMEFVPWVPGTQVGVYQRKSELHMPDMPPPLVENPTSAVVANDNSLTFADVPDGEWWAIGQTDPGYYRYVAFNVGLEP